MTANVIRVECADLREIDKQAAKQRLIRARRDLQKQVGAFGRRRAARVDDDELGAALLLVAHDALEQNGMTPGGVGADEHDEVGFVQILVTARHDVGAEGALVARDR